jgi:hypothetical protein
MRFGDAERERRNSGKPDMWTEGCALVSSGEMSELVSLLLLVFTGGEVVFFSDVSLFQV